jgi:hypothetical protein
MAYAVRLSVPLVQVPAPGPWAYPAQADFVAADAWLGRAAAACKSPEALVLRYLAAYGPASVKDAEAWLGLGGLEPVFTKLAPRLTVIEGPSRKPLYDVPDGPRPGADVPAPVRFLPEWDSVVVTRADERIVAKADRPRVFLPGLRVAALVLVDGFAAAAWTISRAKATATLNVEPFRPLPAAARREVEREGEAVVRFVEPDAKSFELKVTRA